MMIGYTKVNHDLMQRMITCDLSSRQIRVLLFIVRMTVGYGKQTALMSRSFIAKAVNSDVSNVRKDIQRLLDHEPPFIFEIRNGKEVEIGVCGGVEINPTDGVDFNPIGGVENNPQIKKERKENINILFDQFWEAYPKKSAKADAIKAFGTAIKKAPIEMILDGVNGYRNVIEQEKRDSKYIKLPAGWLRSELWNDYKPVEQQKSKLLRLIELHSAKG